LLSSRAIVHVEVGDVKPVFKRALVGCLSIVAIGIVLIGALVGWIGWKGHVARERAEQLCDAFPAGTDAHSFDQRAGELGLRSMPPMPSPEHPDEIDVRAAYDGVMLARWFCTIEVASGKVVTAKVALVD
jgi:hypothetical protein